MFLLQDDATGKEKLLGCKFKRNLRCPIKRIPRIHTGVPSIFFVANFDNPEIELGTGRDRTLIC